MRVKTAAFLGLSSIILLQWILLSRRCPEPEPWKSSDIVDTVSKAPEQARKKPFIGLENAHEAAHAISRDLQSRGLELQLNPHQDAKQQDAKQQVSRVVSSQLQPERIRHGKPVPTPVPISMPAPQPIKKPSNLLNDEASQQEGGEDESQGIPTSQRPQQRKWKRKSAAELMSQSNANEPAHRPPARTPPSYKELVKKRPFGHSVGMNPPEEGSQAFQDEFVFKYVFQGRHGLECAPPADSCFKYIEFGASDGILHSNSLYFERAHRWPGLLIEASGRLVQNILEKRNANVVQGLVCGKEGHVMFRDTYIKGHGHIVEPKDVKTGDIAVQCYTMKELLSLKSWRGDDLALVSIDVEGYELPILESINWDTFSPEVLIIEVDKPQNGLKIRQIMKGSGKYSLPWRIDPTHSDDIYIRNDVNVAENIEIGCAEQCRKPVQCPEESWNDKSPECTTYEDHSMDPPPKPTRNYNHLPPSSIR